MNNTAKYIFLDVDGTLFSPKLGDIPESANEALALARKAGHRIFLCTGRSLAEVSRYLNADVDGFILGAGAMIYADRKRIYDHPFPTADVTRIKKIIRRNNLGYCLEGGAEAGTPVGGPSDSVHHTSSADCLDGGEAFSHRKNGGKRTDNDTHPRTG